MMGNFSFGDYFKDDAIKWAWEFSTEVLKLPKDKLWVTIYENDDQAREIWRDKIGVPDEKIVRLGKEDNFWQIGTGPCGPCSEIYYDRGEAYSCGRPDCKPGCECDRYIEFWNLVFTQFDAKEDGSYGDLVQKNIDTGLGLERMACIMQGVDSIFDVDTLQHVIQAIEKRLNVKYVGDGSGEFDIPIRIVTDHAPFGVAHIWEKVSVGSYSRLFGIGSKKLDAIGSVGQNVVLYPEKPERAVWSCPELNIKRVDKILFVTWNNYIRLCERLPVIVAVNENVIILNMRLFDTAGIPAEEDPSFFCHSNSRATLKISDLLIVNRIGWLIQYLA
jgi:hypothetical protein